MDLIKYSFRHFQFEGCTACIIYGGLMNKRNVQFLLVHKKLTCARIEDIESDIRQNSNMGKTIVIGKGDTISAVLNNTSHLS